MDVKTIKKYNGKKLSWLKTKATFNFNKWIRERDSKDGYFTCISCKRIKSTGQQYHAGHFYSGGHFPEVKFHEDNVHGQCLRCNNYLSGNLAEYKDNLIEKIGKKRFQKIQQKTQITKRTGYKWDRFYLIEIIEKYK